MNTPDVSVIVVTFNDVGRVQACLGSVMEECAGLRSEVIVVDNASTDGTPACVSREYPGIRVIANSGNRGFAAANNQAIRESLGEYLLLLNPDTVVHPGAIRGMLQFLRQHPDIWVAGCRLLSGDGTIQNSVGAFPSVLEGFLKASFLYLLLPECALISHGGVHRFDYTRSAPVDWVMGACFMVRREAFESLGTLDEQFFMYSEEVDFCRRVRNAGREVWYTPEGTVTHFWGGMNAVSGRTLLWLVASQMLYLRKHCKGLDRWMISALKYTGLAARAFVYACAGCVTFNRAHLSKARYAFSALVFLLVSDPAEAWPVH